MNKQRTLWSSNAPPDQQMLAYTVGDDREIDTRLLRWDVLGSLGHLEALRGGEAVTEVEYNDLRKALRAALEAVDSGNLVIGEQHEDCHSAVELWLTKNFGESGERIHAGRSRNDQITLDLRLYLKDQTLQLHEKMLELAGSLIKFGRRYHRVIWPGYTHQRIAMPSSAGVWGAGFAEQLLASAEAIGGLWSRVDRSPLGSAAGYGAPLPLDRKRSAKSMGFSDLDLVVTSVQNARGQLEAAVLFWCLDAAHTLAKLSADVILYSSGEFGWIGLPEELSTGSSIMPQKRNPDLFELTRARAAALSGDLTTVMALKASLPGGYHRDFQLLKAPLFRGIERTDEMLTMCHSAVPKLTVDKSKARDALSSEVFATDAAIQRVRDGVPFRRAYREISGALKRDERVASPSTDELLSARSGLGGLGNPGFNILMARRRELKLWNGRERRRFEKAMSLLAGGKRQ